MSKAKLDNAFQLVSEAGEKAFVPYIMAGDGGLDSLNERIQFLADSGATAIELGLPFSDPVADGPTIQAAGIRALEAGTTVQAVLDEVAKDKDIRSVPLVIMTYLNPVFAYGVEDFASACASAGISGLILPDLPLEEEGLVVDALQKHDIALIRLVALTSTSERIRALAERAEGFLYAVTVAGTTGERATFVDQLGTHLQELKEISKAPVLAGFGVSTPEHVKELSQYCDGVVVGSKIVDALHQGDRQQVRDLIASRKEA
ncbi:tryptophan synthase subunit alpha [Terribacillus saccharophilus]|uniref:tryptophan synthase subunit alpha n=1 Tax=Terribacillus saccharophilus TaxID=361277 RepID=UPI003982913B